jgi:putative DNA primase/helicase
MKTSSTPWLGRAGPMSLRSYAAALGGVVSGNQVCFPGPGHSRQDRSCTLRLSPASPDGFVVFSFAGDDWRTVRDHVRNRLGLVYKQHHAPARQQGIPSENNNTAFALELWRASVPFYGTPGEAYLREERGIVLRNLDHLSHCLPWNYRKGALVALMTDAVTNASDRRSPHLS